MNQLVRWTLSAMLCVAAAGLSACGDDDKGGSSSASGSAVVLRQDSPRAVADSMHGLAMEGNFRRAVTLVAPTHQEAAGIALGALEDMCNARRSLAGAVEAAFGPEAARGVRLDPASQSPLAKAADESGALDWSKIEIAEEGDTASMKINGQDSDSFVKVDGQWYFGEDESPDKFLAMARQMRDIGDEAVRMYGLMEQRIQSGEMDEAKFKSLWDQIEAGRVPVELKSISGVDHSSPQKLIESVHYLAVAGRHEALPDAWPPDFRDSYADTVRAVAELQSAQESLKSTVTKRLGEDAAGQLALQSAAPPSPFQAAADESGALDWSKITIARDGEDRAVRIAGRRQAQRLVQIDGKWYVALAPNVAPAKFKDQAARQVAMARGMIDVMAKTEAGVKSGEITADNVKARFRESMQSMELPR